MTVQFITAERPAFVSGIYTRPYTVRNAGSKDVYLGQDSSLTVGTRSITLTRGATMQWSGDTELWAICAPGEETSIEYIYEGASSVTDGANVTEIDGPVSIDGPVTVEGIVGIDGAVTVTGNVGIDGVVAIDGDVTIDGDVNLAAGTSVDVGTLTNIVNPVTVQGDVAIDGPVTVQGDVGIDGAVTVNGTVDIGAGTVNVGSISGLVDVDVAGDVNVGNAIALAAKPVFIAQQILNPTSASGTQIFNFPQYTIADYASIVFDVRIKYSGAIPPLSEQAYFHCYVNIITSGVSLLTRTYNPLWLINETDAGFVRPWIQFPVTGDTLAITLYWTQPSSMYQPDEVVITMYGSGEIIPSVRYASGGFDFADTMALGGAYALQFSGRVWLASTNSPLTLSAASGNSPNYLNAALEFAQEGQLVNAIGISTQGVADFLSIERRGPSLLRPISLLSNHVGALAYANVIAVPTAALV